MVVEGGMFGGQVVKVFVKFVVMKKVKDEFEDDDEFDDEDEFDEEEEEKKFDLKKKVGKSV